MRRFLILTILILGASMVFAPVAVAVGPKPIHGWSVYWPYIGGEPLDDYPWNDIYSAPSVRHEQFGFESRDVVRPATESGFFRSALNAIPPLSFLSIYLMDNFGDGNESGYRSSIITIR